MKESDILAGLDELLRRFRDDTSTLATLGPDTLLHEDLNISSMDYVDVMLEIEERFDVNISDADAAGITTVGGWVGLIARKRAEAPNG